MDRVSGFDALSGDCSVNPSSAQFFSATSAPTAPLARTTPSRERRWSHRAPCVLRLLDVDGVANLEVRGETVNVSADGLAIQVPEPVPAGLFVETIIARKCDKDAIVVRGKVIHNRRVLAGGWEIGVRTLAANLAPAE